MYGNPNTRWDAPVPSVKPPLRVDLLHETVRQRISGHKANIPDVLAHTLAAVEKTVYGRTCTAKGARQAFHTHIAAQVPSE